MEVEWLAALLMPWQSDAMPPSTCSMKDEIVERKGVLEVA